MQAVRPLDDNTRCVDCGRETLPTDGRAAEWYTVHDQVWADAGMAPLDGCLCVGCIERRLGRRLRAGDFAAVPVNDLSIVCTRKAWSWRTPRLQRRLAAGRRARGRLPVDQAAAA